MPSSDSYYPSDPEIDLYAEKPVNKTREKLREQLRTRMQALAGDAPDGGGFILRTNAEDAADDELADDIAYLRKTWAAVRERGFASPPGTLLYQDLSLVERVLRDLAHDATGAIRIDSKMQYDILKAFGAEYTPGSVAKLEHYKGERPIFDLYGIDEEIARALGRRVELKSGGYLVIDHTEAMTVIDVNTGRFVGKRDQEETILRNNLEAAREIAYQVKLRGIGGIIIVDFIDMEREKNRDKVYHALVDAMSSDKARTRISRVSDLGLIEISRERVREDLLRSLSEPCHYCDGRGYTKSPMSVAYEIFREVRRLGHEIEQQRVVVGAHPAVALLLQEQEQPGVEELERRYSAKILVTPDDRLHLEQFDLVVM